VCSSDLKIVLSALAVLKDKTNDEILNYIKTYKLEKVSVEDIKAADAAKFDASDFNLYEEEKRDRIEAQAAADAEKKEEN
jgi:small subunit ribosomal protein S1